MVDTDFQEKVERIFQDKIQSLPIKGEFNAQVSTKELLEGFDIPSLDLSLNRGYRGVVE